MNSNPPQAPTDTASDSARASSRAAPQTTTVTPPVSARAAAAPVPRKTNVLAIVSLVLAFPSGLMGIILGILSLRQIRRSAEAGRGLAIGAIVVGAITTVTVTLVSALVMIGMIASGVVGTQSDPTDPSSSSLTDSGITSGSVADHNDDADEDEAVIEPTDEAIERYLAALVPDVTAIFREFDPLIEADEVTAAWDEDMLVEFGTQILTDGGDELRDAFVDEVAEDSDGLLTEDRAGRLYDAISDAAQAHLR